MAYTKSGFILEDDAYKTIRYVSETKLAEMKKLSAKKKEELTLEDVGRLLFPEDEDDDSKLVPVDVADQGDDFPETHEEMVEKVGVKAAVEALIKGATTFEKSKAKFSDDKRPIAMTVGEWMTMMGMQAMGAEEDAEEEDLEDDEEIEPTPKKKLKRS
mmetsp:Transcript_96299/g.171073  ORF Transcript_96299/g.171073 Transcript_96299/m.171073 type:complete len:158 (+) Transcript_96299:38-511(+)|eukprot:CAMPEP_0197648104 /NCGR_PEP_ID=MMETSP1338-20131121/27558_1 /TAXON_ID=43686 ORGANISM="Pelagodinium beii, Strain RCC1491" /NCGR_SAMPLE_ID=MMETSP1338 /ASSEMBLY_ACC=CAM_ASM_000754 /LENGTH=157 /DNA_ID=CAMNT_0043222041 /DNA_START=38 /DNA_END=511 /DNA_ORIENTATION=+